MQDVLGSTELNEAVVFLAAGRGDLIRERIFSGVKSYVRSTCCPRLIISGRQDSVVTELAS